MTLQKLDALSYAGKINAFSAETPFSHRKRISGNKYMSFKISMVRTEFEPSEVITDGVGNVSAMPPLIGRPCFGIITAYLRHGSMEEIYVRRMRKTRPSRCGRCGVQRACHGLAKERIKSSPILIEKVAEWVKKGGRGMFKSDSQLRTGKGSWTSLTWNAASISFISSNDMVVMSHSQAKKIEIFAKDRERKRIARKKARQDGIVDADLVAQAIVERERRQMYLEAARKNSAAPHWIKRLPDGSAEKIADAWLTQYLLSVARRKTNPNRVASAMQFQNKYRSSNKDSLRARLAVDLPRVAVLERLALPGSTQPVWPAFRPV